MKVVFIYEVLTLFFENVAREALTKVLVFREKGEEKRGSRERI
jgi:hypothetical protein